VKHPRPSLKDIVCPPEISAFIDRGEIPPAPSSVDKEEVVLSLSVPRELYEALIVTMESRGISLGEATREMVMDYLMKG
jgi:hypothetical protein